MIKHNFDGVKVEPIETVPMNPDIVRITEAVLDQSRRILEMNTKLLSLMAQGTVVLSSIEDKDK